MAQDTPQWNPARTETAIESIADEDVLADLSGHTVLVQATEAANANCQHALFTTVNLLARLDTIVDAVDVVIAPAATRTVYHPSDASETVADGVGTVGDRVGSPVDVAVVDEPAAAYDAVVTLGIDEPAADGFTVRVGSDGWLAHVATTDTAVTFSEQENPVGAYTAGCLTVAEVFKHVLQTVAGDAMTVNIAPVEDVVFSTLDYSVNADDPANPPLSETVDVETLHIFGVGAGGGALLHVLSALEQVAGTVHLVDSDEVSRSNLNRYIWAFADDLDAMKTAVGQRRLRSAHPDLDVRSHPVPYAEFKETADSDRFDLVVSTVDSAAAREEIQWDLPRMILDAATNQRGDYVVSRVVLGETQCLGCKHSRRDGKRQELAVVANRLGLSTDTLETMDKDNAAFSAEQVATIEGHVDGDPAFTIPEPGERFSDWFGDQCGHMDLSAADDPVPVPFLPVTAGVLLAGEIIKERYFPARRVDNRFRHNMFYRPRERKHLFIGPDDACSICRSDRVRDRYHEKWQEGS